MSYDDIAQRVSGRKGWEQFVKEDIVPVVERARTLLELRDRLAVQDQNNPTLADAVDREKRVQHFLVGGITAKGEYGQNALAGLTAQFLGVQLDNPQKWINAQQEGLDAAEYVSVTTSEPDFVSLIETVNEHLTAIVQRFNISISAGDDRADALLENPQNIAEEVQGFLTGLLDLTANSNPFTFFAYTTRSLTRRYLTEAYPQLQYDMLDVAGFTGLEKRFTPDIEDTDKQEAYTIWGHKEDGLLDRLSRVNDAAWSAFGEDEFRSDLSVFFDQVPNLRQDFEQRVKEQLTAEDWSYPNYLPECDPPSRIPTRTAKRADGPRYRQNLDITKAFIIENGSVTAREVITSVNTSSIVHRRKDLDETVSLLRFLDHVMPGVFLGRYAFEIIEYDSRDTPSRNGVRVYHAG